MPELPLRRMNLLKVSMLAKTLPTDQRSGTQWIYAFAERCSVPRRAQLENGGK
jgi:hypothetical protein